MIVDKDIEEDTYWSNKNIYVINAEVHVRVSYTLRIQEGTKVLFRECKLPDVGIGGVPYAVLVVDSGAAILADHVQFTSRYGGINNTGGLIICGTNANAMFEAYATIQSHDNVPSKHSSLQCVNFSKLGNNQYDFNSLTLLQVKDISELTMEDIGISEAGDDGMEVFGGSNVVTNLIIKDCLDDCLDLDSDATLSVAGSLTLINRAIPLIGGGLGPGLVEVIGALGTTNTLVVAEDTYVYMFGHITDKVIGTTVFSGLFAGATAGEVGQWSGTAPPLTFIQGVNP